MYWGNQMADKSIINEEVNTTSDEEGIETLDTPVAILQGFGEEEGVSGDEEEKEGKEDKKLKEEAPKKEIKTTEEITALKNRISFLETHPVTTPKPQERVADVPKKLTQADLEQIVEENADDPKAMLRAVNYMIKDSEEKSAKTSKEIAQEAQRKATHDTFVFQKWPDLGKAGSQLRQQVDSLKPQLGLEGNIMGDFFVMTSLIFDQLPTIQKESYEKGKREALKETTANLDKTRKKIVPATQLTPSGSKVSKEKVIKETRSEVANLLGFSKRANKIYNNLMKQGSK